MGFPLDPNFDGTRLVVPDMADMPEELRQATLYVADRLGQSGFQAWLVGGCVRDLALGREPHDADLVTDARPDDIERAFERTHAVGRAFGTVIVVAPLEGGAHEELEVTTFRAEGEYRDGRRPERVEYADRPEIDALRRDFTCNALYLDPRDNRLLDPTGGWEDLRRGWLRTVGEAAERFAEDGLRLWRMARFQAQLGLEPAPGLLSCSRRERESLVGVSAERVHEELLRILGGPCPERGLSIVEACRLWPAEEVWERWLADSGARERRRRIRGMPRNAPEVSAVGGLALLLCPGRTWSQIPEEPERTMGAEVLDWLRPSRQERRRVLELWRGVSQLELARREGRRATQLRLAQREDLPELLAVARGLLHESPSMSAAEARVWLNKFELWQRGLSESERFPVPYIDASDLAQAGVTGGPSFGVILREAEERQLEGEFVDREEALRWLRGRASQL